MSGDWCTNDGARKLKDKIEAYWRDRGFDVGIDLVDAGFVPAMRSGRTDVRSDMINGMPVKRETRHSTARGYRSPPEESDNGSRWIN